ncbi:MAG TPA: ABC transporter permease subunit [Polyangia bacterium]|jgi:multiple sugar transport system permease protein|nr:ABC transporter permease subunit [Polyangia bacterium]
MTRHDPGTLDGFPDPPATDSVRAEPEVRPRENPLRRISAIHPLVERFGRWVAARGWIHVLLITLVLGCLYPLVWMFLTSIKTDEELGDSNMAPTFPAFRGQSPYVRDDVTVRKPDDVAAGRFAAALPLLRQAARTLVAANLPDDVPASIDRGRWVDSAASALTSRALAQLPNQAWDETPARLAARFGERLTPEAARQALSDQLSRLELSALTLRTLDGRLFKLAGGSDSGGWQLGADNAGFAPSGNAVRLNYQFRSPSDQPIVVAYDFALPPGVDPSDIHKLFLSLRPDDSWHGLTATLDVGGTHWKSTRTTYLAQNRPLSISFQPPTFDDTTVRARTWVPLRAAGSSPRIRQARLELSLTPSSTFTATLAKVERNYLRAFDSVPFLQYVGNSLLLVVLSTLGFLFSSAFVAYAFARLSWPGRSVALVLLLATMMIPSQVTMVPSFLVWRRLGWYDTLNPLWLPSWFGSAFFIFLMIQHMKTIPRELEEAARIDGLGIVKTWWFVIVPQLRPTLAAIAIMSFLGTWNEFMGPLIYLRDQTKFPLSLGLFGMRIDQGADWSMLMAANMLMTLPSVIVFFAFQRYFIEGMTVTGMKG